MIQRIKILLDVFNPADEAELKREVCEVAEEAACKVLRDLGYVVAGHSDYETLEDE